MNKYLLPDVKDMLTVLQEQGPYLFEPLWVTLEQMMLSLFFALVLAIPLAALMMLSKKIGTISQALFLFCKSLPSFALAPLLLAFFGRSSSIILAPTIMMALFPLTISIYKGLQSVPQDGSDSFQVWHGTKLQKLRYLQLPYALPSLFSGLRVAVGIVGLGVISSEWMVGTSQEGSSGLGAVLLEAKEGLDLPLLYVALSMLFGSTSLLYAVVVLAERWSLGRLRLPNWISLFLFLFFAGCQNENASSKRAEDSARKKASLMLDWTANPAHIPFYYGQKHGLFERAGVTLEIIEPGKCDPLQALLSGDIDYAITYFPRLIKVLGREQAGSKSPIEIIAVLFDKPLNGLIAISNTPQRIGLVSGKFPSKTAQKLLNDKKWFSIGFEATHALVSGHVDGVWGVYETIEQTQLEELGVPSQFTSVLDLSMPEYPELVVVTRKENGRNGAKFAEALSESIGQSISQEAEAYQIFLEKHPIRRGRKMQWEAKAWKKVASLLAKKQRLPKHHFERIVEWLVAVEQLDSSPHYMEVVAAHLNDLNSAPAASS